MVHLIPVSKTISFTPIKKRFLSAAAVGWGLSTTQNQTAAAAFFRNWLVLPRCDEWTSSSQDWQCCCREECGWHWRTAYRLVVFKEIDAGKPFSLASTACKAPMRATIRNFWLPCRLLGNTVPIRLLEEGSWSSAGLSSHCWFFVMTLPYIPRNRHNNIVSAKPLNDASQEGTARVVCDPDPFLLLWSFCSFGRCSKCLGIRHLLPQGVSEPDLHLPNCAAHPHYCQPQPHTDAVCSCWDQSCRSRPSSAHQMARSAVLVLVLAYLFAPRLLTVMWIWEGKKEKTSQELIGKKKRSRSFLFMCYLKTQKTYSRSILNLLRKGRDEEIGQAEMRRAPWDWATWTALPGLHCPRDRRGSPEDCSVCLTIQPTSSFTAKWRADIFHLSLLLQEMVIYKGR